MNQFPFQKISGSTFSGIPTAKEWQSVTTVKSFGIAHKRVNPLMIKIDEALEKYHRSVSAPFRPEMESSEAKITRIRLTLLMVLDASAACFAWIKAKAKTDRSNRREKVVRLCQELGKASKTLSDELERHGRGIPHGLKEDEEKDPIDAVKVMNPRLRLRLQMGVEAVKQLGLQGKRLDPSYWVEANLGGANPQHIPADYLFQSWKKSDDRLLFDHIRKNESRLAHAEVLYVESGDLWKYQIIFREGLLHRRLNSHSHDAGDKITCRNAVFVIDNINDCYVSLDDDDSTGPTFHHSSVPAGGSVKFAGTIYVEEGKLTLMGGESGHYKTTTTQLVKALDVMNWKNVPLDDVKVVDLTPGADADEVPAKEFLRKHRYSVSPRFIQQ